MRHLSSRRLYHRVISAVVDRLHPGYYTISPASRNRGMARLNRVALQKVGMLYRNALFLANHAMLARYEQFAYQNRFK